MTKVLPKGIDDPLQILLFRIDDLLPFLIALFVGVLTEQLTGCLLCGLLLVRVFRRFRENRLEGWLQHQLYWLGLWPLAGRTLRNPFQRRYVP